MKIALNHTLIGGLLCYKPNKLEKISSTLSRKLPLNFVLLLTTLGATNSGLAQLSLKEIDAKNSKTVHIKTSTSKLNYFKSDSNIELDTDEDGVIDILDFDDDNDGILDTQEGFFNINSLRGQGIIVTINGAWVLTPTSVYFEIPENLKHGDEFWLPFMGEQYVKAVRIRFENSLDGIRFIQTAAKHTIGNNPDLDTNLNYNFDNGGIVSPIALSDTDEGYGIASIEYKDNVVISEYLGEVGKTFVVPALDTDNDGLIDSKDTDSDNDGCPDVIEAGNNINTTYSLTNGSNGGSLENLGVSSNNNGIPLPFGTEGGNEEIGQENNNACITSEQLSISNIEDVEVNEGDNVSLTVEATAIKTSTYNIGVPNYSLTYGTDTSELITYKWFREDNLSSVVSESKNLTFNNITKDDSGNYIVKVQSANNNCIEERLVKITVDGVLSTINNSFDNLEYQLSIYPNPSNGDFNLKLNSKENNQVKVSLYDLNGRVIYNYSQEIEVGENKIDLRFNSKKGLFILKVSSNEIDYGFHKVIFK